jgi:hypothetical protein
MGNKIYILDSHTKQSMKDYISLFLVLHYDFLLSEEQHWAYLLLNIPPSKENFILDLF